MTNAAANRACQQAAAGGDLGEWCGRFPLVDPCDVAAVLHRAATTTNSNTNNNGSGKSAVEAELRRLTNAAEKRVVQTHLSAQRGEAQIAAMAATDDDAASVWQHATARQRERMIAHYLQKFPSLSQVVVVGVLASTFDLAAASARFEKMAASPDDHTVVQQVKTTESRKCRLYKKRNKTGNNVTVPAPGSPAAAGGSAAAAAAAASPDVEDHADAPDVVASAPRERRATAAAAASAASLPLPGTAAYEVAFFSQMFPTIPLARIVDVLAVCTDTERRIEILMTETAAATAAAEEDEDAHRLRRRRTPVPAPVLQEAARRIGAANAQVDAYQSEFPTLDREVVADVMKNSSNVRAALARMAARDSRAAQLENHQQLHRADEDDGVAVHNATADVSSADFSAVTVAALRPDCVVCMSASRTHIVIPCGHYCLCEDCAHQLEKKQGTRTCAVCRTAIAGIFKVFE